MGLAYFFSESKKKKSNFDICLESKFPPRPQNIKRYSKVGIFTSYEVGLPFMYLYAILYVGFKFIFLFL